TFRGSKRTEPPPKWHVSSAFSNTSTFCGGSTPESSALSSRHVDNWFHSLATIERSYSSLNAMSAFAVSQSMRLLLIQYLQVESKAACTKGFSSDFCFSGEMRNWVASREIADRVSSLIASERFSKGRARARNSALKTLSRSLSAAA